MQRVANESCLSRETAHARDLSIARYSPFGNPFCRLPDLAIGVGYPPLGILFRKWVEFGRQALYIFHQSIHQGSENQGILSNTC